jgi:aminoglycoside phosphotransferase (APT) family kinase protein
MFDAFLSAWDDSLETVLVHGDLGPAHILHRGSSVTGVIDWSDACLGDPALDFAWLLHSTRREFSSTLLGAYLRESGSGLRDRSLFYHRLGPWHEVLFGIKHARSDLIETGLAGIRARLP